ncbi:PP2C family serine/threonine-protein phosphatase [Ruegeria sp. EL01]|uniref:PP2C family protein-serine/threonine phosphatase n=1 Tax=Ruegeria sp. EL01 TaxID=2107578 RepID=UPI0013C52D74|nr:protein phosphatase 2C domain-containing protein [Ruegeria sp. EL01]
MNLKNLLDPYSEKLMVQLEKVKGQKIWGQSVPRIDMATAIDKGQRDYQEDAILMDCPVGSDTGIVVVSDGMGGHAAGDIASKIVATEVFKYWKFSGLNCLSSDAEVRECLLKAAEEANGCLSEVVSRYSETKGMGATLLALVLIGTRAFWMSIGDSPLYRLRDGELCQLNEDHSMAPQIDMMVKLGMLDQQSADEHPDRNTLTSVIMGGDIPKIDCPEHASHLEPGDILIAATDGLQFLSEEEIQSIVAGNQPHRSETIVARLVRALEDLEAPDQDNFALSVIKIGE